MSRDSVEMTILYEDAYLIAVSKPSGLLSVATERERETTAFRMVSDYVKEYNRKAKVFVLHRIDRDTSGVLLFAKSEDIKNILQSNWDKAVLERGYVAVVEGEMTPESGEIKSYITENKAMVVHSTDSMSGKLAITRYTTIQSSGSYSLLKINILTGRKNQIRVQMSESGHPITGDKKYGAKRNPIKRLALHADKIVLIHPVTGKKLTLKSPVPKQFKFIF